MRNLAGVEEADQYIQEELLLAGIDIVKAEAHREEVPYTLEGKLGPWTFTRAQYYWRVNAPDGEGLPLDFAVELHTREYPIKGEKQPKTYGNAVRVSGHCGCPHPEYGVRHFDANKLEIIVDPDGKDEAGWKDH